MAGTLRHPETGVQAYATRCNETRHSSDTLLVRSCLSYDVPMFVPGRTPSRPASPEKLLSLLRRYHVIYGLSLPRIELRATEITAHAFYGCNFSHAHLRECRFEQCAFELCFLDSVTFERCVFSGTEIRNCVMALSSFTETLFEGSNLIQCNFNGCSGNDLSFDDCDLLHSRFDALTVKTSLVNCNVKQVRFLRTEQSLLHFRASNQEDAVFLGEDGW